MTVLARESFPIPISTHPIPPMKTEPISREEKEASSSTHIVTEQERVDEAIAESFPASDPPSWNAGVSHEPVHDACAPGPDELKERGKDEE